MEVHTDRIDLLLGVVLVLRSNESDRFGFVDVALLLLGRWLSVVNSLLLPILSVFHDLIKELSFCDILPVLLQLHVLLLRHV